MSTTSTPAGRPTPIQVGTCPERIGADVLARAP
jgi:hypothetical protein